MSSNEDLQQKVADALDCAGVDLVNVATSSAALDAGKLGGGDGLVRNGRCLETPFTCPTGTD